MDDQKKGGKMMTQEKETLSSYITRIKKEKGLTAAELSRKIGVSRQTMSLWENGKRTPSLKHAIRLAEALNIPTVEILKRFE